MILRVPPFPLILFHSPFPRLFLAFRWPMLVNRDLVERVVCSRSACHEPFYLYSSCPSTLTKLFFDFIDFFKKRKSELSSSVYSIRAEENLSVVLITELVIVYDSLLFKEIKLDIQIAIDRRKRLKLFYYVLLLHLRNNFYEINLKFLFFKHIFNIVIFDYF